MRLNRLVVKQQTASGMRYQCPYCTFKASVNRTQDQTAYAVACSDAIAHVVGHIKHNHTDKLYPT